MKQRRIGIIMHGVTGRMGMNQHLIRSILAIREQGGVALKDGTALMPDPIIVGRNADKVAALAARLGVERWTDDLDAALGNPDDTLFFDAASTALRPELLRRAIDAGKDVYCEKPVAEKLEDAVAIARPRITVDDHGTVLIYATEGQAADSARRMVHRLVGVLEVDHYYRGVVTGVKDFGVFVKVNEANEGLVPKDQLATGGSDAQPGQEVVVKVLGADDRGRLRLSIREAEGADPARIEG